MDCFFVRFVFEVDQLWAHSWALVYFLPALTTRPVHYSAGVGLFACVNALALVELVQGNQYCRDPLSFCNPLDALPVIVYAVIIYFLLQKKEA